ncbi:hypothetical protein MMC31_006013 [Peltigera leucophlebia]|nr:hypothetical protein [Peltigera leucophlebia]
MAHPNQEKPSTNSDKTAYQIPVPPRLAAIRAAIRAAHRQQIYENWKTSWNNEIIKGRDLRLLVSQPDRKSKIHTKLKKPQSSLQQEESDFAHSYTAGK